MPRENPQHRRIRLASAVYADVGEICSINVAVKGRTPVFASAAVAAAAVDVLRRQAAANGRARLRLVRDARPRSSHSRWSPDL